MTYRTKLTITHNDDIGFYVKEDKFIQSSLLMYRVLHEMIARYNLLTPKTMYPSEMCLFLDVADLNQVDFDIQLLEEDGSKWIF